MAISASGPSTPETSRSAPATAGPIKNLIVMVADGGGFNTIEAVRQYLGDARGGPRGELAVDQDGFVATARTTFPLSTRTAPLAGPEGLAQDPLAAYDPARNYDFTPVAGDTSDGFPRGFAGYEWNRATAPDSANTMSAMMTGAKTYNNAVNVDGNGNPLFSVPELAASLGKAAGVVSTVQFSDATPSAGGGAHNIARGNSQAIAQEMFAAGVLDVIAGTGNPDYDDDGDPVSVPRHAWIGEDLWNALKDDSFRSADGEGWTLLQNRADIQAAGTGTPTDERLAMIVQAFTGANYYRSGDDPANEDPFTAPRLQTSPTLTELSQAALNRLNADPDGLYLTIEAGAVDRAMHDNNFGRMIEEYIEFDQAVRFVLDWIDSPESRVSWDDTLLIVTADHDHLLFGPEGETIPYQAVQADRDGDGVPEYQWFDNSHSNQPIPLHAYGAGAELVPLLADRVDAVLGGQGERIAGSGRSYTDQAELGTFLLEQLRLGAAQPQDDAWPS
jgi:alkaline phosphatase